MEISVSIEPKVAGPIFQDDIQSASYAWKTAKFTATVENDPANAGVTWAVAQGGGSINDQGIYSPPVDARRGTGQSTISATSKTDKTKSATAICKY